MKTASAKNKGRMLQKLIRDKILSENPELHESDVLSTSMGVTGEDVKLSAKAFEVFPYFIEAKNQERLNIWESYKQAESHLNNVYGDIKSESLLVIKRNRQKALAVVDLDHFIQLVRRTK